VQDFLEQSRASLLQQTGDLIETQQLAVQVLDNLRQQQASSLAYFDVFLICAALGVTLVPLVFFMKRSVAEKGSHIGAE